MPKHYYLWHMKGTRSSGKAVTRILVFASLFAYCLSSVGVIKATHFCMGRESSVKLFTTEADKCACSLYAGESDACCDDKHELVRIDDDQNSISSMVYGAPVLALIGQVANVATDELPVTSQAKYTPGEAPPLPRDPLWIRNCSLVFYDRQSLA